ncbi:hypothetical protein D8X92_13705 [Listeria ivanovii]|uniref:Uncharacterized protein n=2 Tax=Listeriaceae TaxID=186820 RepID=A0ABS1G7X0_LISIV|nr:hypothetical protein [Listeria ivanovii]MBK1962943.1 hypothetical protein [Listeria ivanovii subsp. londoniensis]MBM5721745.1 hypothetical protein [Listeria ivanovii]
MEIKVTGVPKTIVQAIDLRVEAERLMEEELSQLNKLTRESYLRNYFEFEAVAPEVHQKEMAYESLIIRLLYFLERNNLEWLQLFALLDENWKETIENESHNNN